MLGQAIATQAGLDAQRASQIGLMQGLLGVSVPSFLISQELVRREAAATNLLPIPAGNDITPMNTIDNPCTEARDAALEATSAAQAASLSAHEIAAAAAEADKAAERVLRVARETRTFARTCAEELQTHRTETQVVLHEHTHALEEIKDLLQKVLDSK